MNATKKNKKTRKRGPQFSRFKLNCESSRNTETDWAIEDAAGANFLKTETNIPASKDLRADWWPVRHQGGTGACVGFAVADGLLRWHYIKEKIVDKNFLPSPRFIWMANKETDDLTRYPTTFLESAGTSTKLGLKVAQRYGCVPDHMLPMSGKLSPDKPNVFFSVAAHYRINSYYQLKGSTTVCIKAEECLNNWKRWIAQNGPVLTRLDVDDTWRNSTANKGVLDVYGNKTPYGGHAVCLVGYTNDYFIVRNSWGQDWGDNGFAYASNEYAMSAFTEAYGTVVTQKKASALLPFAV